MRVDDADEEKKMRAPGVFPAARALVIVFVLWGFAFALACRLLSMPEGQSAADGVVAKLLGGLCGEISGQFYEHADTVFHKGMGASHSPALQDWFVRMKKEVVPADHQHLHEDGVLDIIPWLFFAVRADPGNSSAYIVAAFWLAVEAGRPELAEQVLDEAVRNNPSDYRVYLEKGKLEMKLGNLAGAARAFDAAYALWPGPAGRDNGDARVDRGEMLTYRGLLYEIERNPEKALTCYREIVRMFPGRLQLAERIPAIEKNGRAPTPPEDMAKILLLQRRFVCSEHEHE